MFFAFLYQKTLAILQSCKKPNTPSLNFIKSIYGNPKHLCDLLE